MRQERQCFKLYPNTLTTRRAHIRLSYSWQYIERSVRNGVLENLEDHRVGEPRGTVRTVGSVTIPTKGTRTPFTAEDDRVLFEWVAKSEARGGAVLGNKIYEQLAAQVDMDADLYYVNDC